LVVLAVCALLAFAGCGSPTSKPADRTTDGKDAADKGSDGDKAKEDAARAQIKALEQAVEIYKKNHGAFPTDLGELTQVDPANGNKPYLTGDRIRDPWDKPYQLDEKGTKNKGAKPDIFSTSPKGKQIGNWSD
jgi:type II secretory pathway pseudopilin PulG